MPPKKKGRKKLPDHSGVDDIALPPTPFKSAQVSTSSAAHTSPPTTDTKTPAPTGNRDGPNNPSADLSVQSTGVLDVDSVHEESGDDLMPKKKKKSKKKKKKSKQRKATTAALEHKDPTTPHIRTCSELEKPISELIKRLVKEWSYKPDRSIDTNAFLPPGGDWQYSHVFARNGDPFLLLWRIAKLLGFIADVDSWMNINQRDSASHKAVDSRKEAQCPTLSDIEAFIKHCDNNAKLLSEGKKPISIFEATGFEPGTIFTYLVVNFGRRGDVPFHATEDGSDLNSAMFILRLSNANAASSTRIQHTQGHPAFVIPALLCGLRWHVMQDQHFLAKDTSLPGDIRTGCNVVYNYAKDNGWFLPATKEEISELVAAGVLASATCRKALFFQGITKGKAEPFFYRPPVTTTSPKPVVANASQPRQSLGGILRSANPPPPTRPVTPTQQHGRKRAPESPSSDSGSPSRPPWKQARLREHPSVLPDGEQKEGEYTARYVSALPLRAQNLSSHRPIRPQFKRVLVDGDYKLVLPEEWIKNPPANAHAPIEFAIANSLYPRQTVAAPDDDATPDNAVAGPGPSTISMTLRKGKRTKA